MDVFNSCWLTCNCYFYSFRDLNWSGSLFIIFISYFFEYLFLLLFRVMLLQQKELLILESCISSSILPFFLPFLTPLPPPPFSLLSSYSFTLVLLVFLCAINWILIEQIARVFSDKQEIIDTFVDSRMGICCMLFVMNLSVFLEKIPNTLGKNKYVFYYFICCLLLLG